MTLTKSLLKILILTINNLRSNNNNNNRIIVNKCIRAEIKIKYLRTIFYSPTTESRELENSSSSIEPKPKRK